MDNMNIDSIPDSLPLTLGQYLENPTGTKYNSFMNLSMVRDTLDERYLRLQKEGTKVELKFYKKDSNTIYVHALVPSESYKLKYDVVLEVKMDGNLLKNQMFRVFSNSPSFVYTYAYVFNIHGLLIDELTNKYEKEVLTKQPVQKNYYKVISYEKSLYFAITYLLSEYQYTSDIDKEAKTLKKEKESNVLFNSISTDKEKQDEYQRKRKRDQYLKKHDASRAMAELMKKDAMKRQRQKEKFYGNTVPNKNDITRTKPTSGSSHKVTPKSKIKGKSKISGKAKRR